MNVIIIDDEKNGAEALQLLLKHNCRHVNTIALKHSPEEGIESILTLQPDLVFLDIEMPNASGFDVIKATKEINYEVIFTTAYEQYAIKAFKTQAVDYLLKPIDVEELVAAVKSAETKIEAKSNKVPADLEALVKKIVYSSKKISVPTSEGIHLFDAREIVRLESDSNYTNIFLKSGQKFLISKTLKSIADQLKEYNFCRVHSAHLVNLDEVDKYIKGDGGTLILKNKISIPVSRNNKAELLNKIGL
ncbi:MAG: response regulator transcription factor [Bacteroidetes bacterium]|nr:response regulator transcription factor [Bacteroidota bacterium]